MDLQGKIAVVTGGGKGLGRDISRTLSRAGAKLAIVGRTPEPLEETASEIRAAGGEACAIAGDASTEDGVQKIADAVFEAFDTVDVLINNAAIGGPSKPLWQLHLGEWQETFDINTTGPFLCCRAFLPKMIEQNSGSIVFIGSMTGKRALLNRTPYAASKIAIVGMVRTLAWEVGPHNIRINMISPGPMEGERMKWVLESQAKDQGITIEEARGRLTSASPLHRFVDTQSVADATLFLASDGAASITGEDLNISSGICMF